MQEPKPIISVKEARKRLVKVADDMTDEEVARVVQDLDDLARFLLDMYQESKLKKYKNGTPLNT